MQMHGIYLDQELLNEYFLSKKLMRKSMDAKVQRNIPPLCAFASLRLIFLKFNDPNGLT
jgi:hypothetical protein